MEIELGCKIKQGPQDWQIYQMNEDDFANISLSGTWALPDNAPGQVMLRVVNEETHEAVFSQTEWQKADIIQGNTWKTILKVPAGGLYRIETCILEKTESKETLPDSNMIEWAFRGDFIHHIGVGDLWVIAGQSNAAGYGRGPVNDAPEIGVHILRNEEKWDIASHPLNDTRNNKHPNCEGPNPGHSPFLMFAKLLKKSFGYPIGLIQTSLGGSPLSAWNPVENPSAPLYKNMFHCINLSGGKIKGICWYQGESDACEGLAETYKTRFIQFVEKTRQDLNSPELPFITVQLNKFHQINSSQDKYWSIIKETQRIIPHILKNVAVIPAIDLPLSDLIHTSPSGNLILGQRFANAALGMVYKKDINYLFPEIKSSNLKENGKSVILKFENVRYRLNSDLPFCDNFVVEDKDGVAAIEKAEFISNSEIALTLKRKIFGEAYIHYGYGLNPTTNIYEVITNKPLLCFYGFKMDF
jgi:hypothetical protein